MIVVGSRSISVPSECAQHRVSRGKFPFRATAMQRFATGFKRQPPWAWGCLAAIATLLAFVPDAGAAGECQSAFAAWAKLSERHVRAERTGHNDGGTGACIPSEALRIQLLNGLASARALCEQTSSWFDQSPQQTKIILGINENFIASLT